MTIEKDKTLSKKEAIDLLFADVVEQNTDIFDIYGNYIYPTEVVMEYPNVASGTPTAILDIKNML